jgi:hypothetical protein
VEPTLTARQTQVLACNAPALGTIPPSTKGALIAKATIRITATAALVSALSATFSAPLFENIKADPLRQMKPFETAGELPSKFILPQNAKGFAASVANRTKSSNQYSRFQHKRTIHSWHISGLIFSQP